MSDYMPGISVYYLTAAEMAENDREVAEKAAAVADQVGLDNPGPCARLAFEAATQIREAFGVAAPEPDDVAPGGA